MHTLLDRASSRISPGAPTSARAPRLESRSSSASSMPLIEGWLESTLSQSLGDLQFSTKAESSAMKRLGIGREELGNMRIDRTAQDRIYRSFFVYSIGMHDIISDFSTAGDGKVHLRLWDVFMRLLECCDPKHSELYSIFLRQRHDASLRELIAEQRDELEDRREECQRLHSEEAKAQMSVDAMKYESEQAALVHIALKASFERREKGLRDALAVEKQLRQSLDTSLRETREQLSLAKRSLTDVMVSEHGAKNGMKHARDEAAGVRRENKDILKTYELLKARTEAAESEKDRYRERVKELQRDKEELRKALTQEETEVRELTRALNVSKRAEAISQQSLCTLVTKSAQMAECLRKSHHVLNAVVENSARMQRVYEEHPVSLPTERPLHDPCSSSRSDDPVYSRKAEAVDIEGSSTAQGTNEVKVRCTDDDQETKEKCIRNAHALLRWEDYFDPKCSKPPQYPEFLSTKRISIADSDKAGSITVGDHVACGSKIEPSENDLSDGSGCALRGRLLLDTPLTKTATAATAAAVGREGNAAVGRPASPNRGSLFVAIPQIRTETCLIASGPTAAAESNDTHNMHNEHDKQHKRSRCDGIRTVFNDSIEVFSNDSLATAAPAAGKAGSTDLFAVQASTPLSLRREKSQRSDQPYSSSSSSSSVVALNRSAAGYPVCTHRRADIDGSDDRNQRKDTAPLGSLSIGRGANGIQENLTPYIKDLGQYNTIPSTVFDSYPTVDSCGAQRRSAVATYQSIFAGSVFQLNSAAIDIDDDAKQELRAEEVSVLNKAISEYCETVINPLIGEAENGWFVQKNEVLNRFVGELWGQLPLLANARRNEEYYRRTIAATATMRSVFESLALSNYSQSVLQRKEISQHRKTMEDLSERNDSLSSQLVTAQQIAAKYNELQPKFMQLVEHYKQLAYAKNETEKKIRTESVLHQEIAELTQELKSSQRSVALLTAKAAERTEYIKYLQAEALQLSRKYADISGKSSSFRELFACLHRHLGLVEECVEKGFSAHAHGLPAVLFPPAAAAAGAADDSSSSNSDGAVANMPNMSSAVAANAKIVREMGQIMPVAQQRVWSAPRTTTTSSSSSAMGNATGSDTWPTGTFAGSAVTATTTGARESGQFAAGTHRHSAHSSSSLNIRNQPSTHRMFGRIDLETVNVRGFHYRIEESLDKEEPPLLLTHTSNRNTTACSSARSMIMSKDGHHNTCTVDTTITTPSLQQMNEISTQKLRAQLDSIRYLAEDAISKEERKLTIHVVEVILRLPLLVVELLAHGDAVFTRDREYEELMQEMERLKMFFAKERRRLIEHYEERLKDGLRERALLQAVGGGDVAVDVEAVDRN